MLIESPVISCGRSAAFLHEYLSTPSNLEPLLPAEHVSEFSAEGDTCSFKVTGGFAVVLKRVEGEADRIVRYASQKAPPFVSRSMWSLTPRAMRSAISTFSAPPTSTRS